MPTRVILREVTAPSAAGQRRQNQNDPGSPTTSVSSPKSSLAYVSFRQSVRGDEPDETELRISSTDIRGSPRMLAYFLSGIASMVVLISVVEFYRTGDNSVEFNRRLEQQNDGETVVVSYGTTVLRFKLIGSIVMSSAGVFINAIILFLHFETICAPKLWSKVFCDGSLIERNLIIGLILFWLGGLYFCTSAFSVGEVQPNVYFATWIAFFAAVLNLGVWRSGADKPTLQEMVQQRSSRETTRNWIGTLFFSTITALSVSDLYTNRQNLTFIVQGEEQQPPQQLWIQVLCVVYACLATCILVLVCNHYLTEPLPLCGSRFSFDWRHVEGILVLALISIWAWNVMEYTGVNGAFSQPSNPYFGIWGTFFFSILTFGTWLKENKDFAPWTNEARAGTNTS